jgi:hypothetical protein
VNARRLVIAVILCICVGAPIVEMLDQWDHTLHDGNDTEANLVVVALCVGLALSVARSLAHIRSLSCTRPFYRRPACAAGRFAASWSVNPIPNSRPPTVLRV